MRPAVCWSRARLCFGIATAVSLLALVAASDAAAAAKKTAAPKSLKVAFVNQLTTLDPDKAGQDSDQNALHLIGGDLVEEEANGKLVNVLAQRLTESKNKLKWTVTLRPGLKFSDGTPITANDVVATFERTINDKSKLGGVLYNFLTSVTASGSRTVVFNFSSPFPDFRASLVALPIFPASGLAKGASFFSNPISAGPYKLASWGGSQTSTYTANPNYVGPKPAIKNITFVTIADPSASIAALKSHQVDLVFSIPPSLVPAVKGGGISAATVPTWGYLYLVPRVKSAPFNDIGVRTAIWYALDRARIVKTVWPQGGSYPLAGFWPKGLPGYDASLPTKQDLAKAKRALVGTPCANGCTITLEYPGTYIPYGEQIALLVRQDLAKVGIKVNLSNVDFGTWASHNLAGTCGCLTMTYGWTRLPFSNALTTFLQKPFWGFSYYDDPNMDGLINRLIQTEPDTAARTKSLKLVQSRFIVEKTQISIAGYTQTYATRLKPCLAFQDTSTFLEVVRQGSSCLSS
jgi:peptide/nickel transport system substrate-binding protein